MSTVGVFTESPPTSNHVASVIGVLDEENPDAYQVKWRGEKESHDKTYDVVEIEPDGRPRLFLEGNWTIDANPPGQPQVLDTGRSDGYVREQRLAEFRLFAEQYHWEHQVKYISDQLQRKLDLTNPFS